MSGTPLRVLLATSWNTACGIADHSAQLIRYAVAADPYLAIIPSAEALDPHHPAIQSLVHDAAVGIDLLHLNHHDALHSRWTPERVAEIAKRIPVLVTYHDTRETVEGCPKALALSKVASSLIVHEPVEGLPAIYWRQGVPAAARAPMDYAHNQWGSYGTYDWGGDGSLQMRWRKMWKAYPQQPVLGTVGFNFPWKNYDRLARATAEAGWALLILSANATEDDEVRWQEINPYTIVGFGFKSTEELVNNLAGCDATAFMYECANTGTSGAIRLGLAARKPVIALRSCRQFRDLQLLDPARRIAVGPSGVAWVDDWSDFALTLRGINPHPWQAEVAARAEEDSWARLGARYAELYRRLVAR